MVSSIVHKLAVLDALGYTDDDAAVYLNLPARRIRALRKTPAYQDAYTAVVARNLLQLSTTETAAISGARELIAQNLGKAIQTLLELMRDPNVPPNVRLQAANSLLMRAGLTAKTADLVIRGPSEPMQLPASSSPELIRALTELVEAIKEPLPVPTTEALPAEVVE